MDYQLALRLNSDDARLIATHVEPWLQQVGRSGVNDAAATAVTASPSTLELGLASDDDSKFQRQLQYQLGLLHDTLTRSLKTNAGIGLRMGMVGVRLGKP